MSADLAVACRSRANLAQFDGVGTQNTQPLPYPYHPNKVDAEEWGEVLNELRTLAEEYSTAF